MFEISLTGDLSEDNQAEVTAVISFEGKEKQIKGFYAGNGVYKVRFLPESAGLYRWKVTGRCKRGRRSGMYGSKSRGTWPC